MTILDIFDANKLGMIVLHL